MSHPRPDGTFTVLGPRRVAYLDFFGSGAETVAHLGENGRIAVMFCAFGGPPRILRLHGTGEVVWPDDPRFDELLDHAGFAGLPQVQEARRAIVVIEVARIAESCYGVPLMEQVGEREHYDLSERKRLRTLGSQGMRRLPGRSQRPKRRRFAGVPERAPRAGAARYGPGSRHPSSCSREPQLADGSGIGPFEVASDLSRGPAHPRRLGERPGDRAAVAWLDHGFLRPTASSSCWPATLVYMPPY